MNTLEGIVVSNKTKDTLLVEVVRRTAHPMYKKLIKRNKRYKVDPGGVSTEIGDTVRIGETRPFSKEKYFKVLSVVKKGNVK